MDSGQGLKKEMTWQVYIYTLEVADVLALKLSFLSSPPGADMA